MEISKPTVEQKSFRITNRFRRNVWGLIFALPATLLFVVFAAYPILQTFLFSFYNYNLGGEKVFTGLSNYSYILQNQVFQQSFTNTIFYAVGTYIPTLVFALLIAMALNARIPFRGTLRMMNFIPVVISWVIVAVVWKLLFHQNGLINQFLGNFNIAPINWLLSEQSAMWAIIIPSVWKEVGFFMVIFLAGLQTIPQEYYEASQIDGATRMQSFYHITLPLLRPTMVLAIILAIINGMKVFIPTFVMTQGGPAGTTRVMALIIYQTAFSYNRIGRASAMAVVLFLTILTFTLIQSRIYGTRRD